MKTTVRILFLMSICLIALCANATDIYAATVNVADYGDGTCSLANAQSAYNASSAGDTIVFPANGRGTWNAALTIRKPLIIIGAGTKLSASGTLANGFFHITGFTSSTVMRVTGFWFEMTNQTPTHGILVNSVALDNLRIDHNRFNHGLYQIVVGGSKGVIDHNDFYNGNVAIYYTAGSSTQAMASWVSMAAGTADAMFIEDNNFIDDADYTAGYSNERIGTYNGGKLVVRYNHYDSDDFPLSTTVDPFMAHGSAAGGVENGHWQIGTGARRGQSVIEFYNNIMHGKRIDFMFISRGSANIVHGNAITGKVLYSPRIYFYEEEYSEAQWNPMRTEWPAEDQVHNTFIWNNTYNGIQMDSSDVAARPNDKIIENRDYFLHEPQATGGKATFTGLNGAAGSYPTDGNTYPTLGTMIFLPDGPNAYYGYTPYTYPHPLTLFENSLVPPTGLTVIATSQ